MSNKTALITGATGGLGKEFVRIFSQHANNLILVGRNPEKLASLKEATENKFHNHVDTITVDFTDNNAAETIFNKTQKLDVEVEYLVNNAGLGGQGTFLDRTMDQDINMAKVNMLVPTKLMKLFLPEMVKRNEGRILNISSSAALTPGPLQAEYYATKAYLTSLSNAIAYELKDTNITVTTLMPGAMDTGFAKAGELTETKMFANGVSPKQVAEEGYEEMLKGKMNVFAGLPGWQRPFVKLMPMLPKKTTMSFVASQQSTKN